MLRKLQTIQTSLGVSWFLLYPYLEEARVLLKSVAGLITFHFVQMKQLLFGKEAQNFQENQEQMGLSWMAEGKWQTLNTVLYAKYQWFSELRNPKEGIGFLCRTTERSPNHNFAQNCVCLHLSEMKTHFFQVLSKWHSGFFSYVSVLPSRPLFFTALKVRDKATRKNYLSRYGPFQLFIFSFSLPVQEKLLVLSFQQVHDY